jgi:hypothetical protein
MSTVNYVRRQRGCDFIGLPRADPYRQDIHCRLRKRDGKSASRIVMTALIVACVGYSEVLACAVPGPLPTIIFTYEDLSNGIDAPAIVEVTIMGYNEGFVARVEKVLKGQIDGAEIKIVANLSTCGFGFAIGERGIVVGALRRDARGSLELIAVEEWPANRHRRRASKANR